jgi:hypothetical protein
LDRIGESAKKSLLNYLPEAPFLIVNITQKDLRDPTDYQERLNGFADVFVVKK